MRLRDLLDEAVLKIGLESVDKEECFEEMVDVLVRAGRITDRSAALRVILDREDLATTGIGDSGNWQTDESPIPTTHSRGKQAASPPHFPCQSAIEVEALELGTVWCLSVASWRVVG